MNLASDNTSGVAPEIFDALRDANTGSTDSYGADPWTGEAREHFRKVFECPELEIYPLSTGTAANALALAALTPPFGAILCHPASHIQAHQCAAPEFFTGGAKLLPVQGPHGKVAPEALEARLAAWQPGDVHEAQLKVLSLTQSTDFGALYTVEEIEHLTRVAHDHELMVHMDGARFANAVAALGVSPAELSWRSGVDILCFGASKNGALAAEAVVVFRPDLAEDLGFRRKRGGHLLSKMRYCSAQLVASLRNDLWLHLARHSNHCAQHLASGLESLEAIQLLHPVATNMLWFRLPEAWATALDEAGYPMLTQPEAGHPGWVRTRWVTAWDTKEEDLDRLLSFLKGLP